MEVEQTGPFGPEDEHSHFIPPQEANEDDAEEARAKKLDQIQPSGNLISDAKAFFDAEGLIPPKIVEDGNEARTLDLLRRTHEDYSRTIQRIGEHSHDHPNEAGHMSWQEKEFNKSAEAALKRILDAHNSK